MNSKLFIKPVMIFGCGNSLIGDDGFGPAVIDHLLVHYRLPEFVMAVDAGINVSDYLIDILLGFDKPAKIYIVDAVSSTNGRPGEISEVMLDDLPVSKASNFSLHQFPSVNLLKEIYCHTRVDVRMLAVQTGHIPEVMQPGLSPDVQKAVEPACRWLLNQIEQLSVGCTAIESMQTATRGSEKLRGTAPDANI
jgi:coenzyme F420 hydrogenase subunit delta